MGVFILSEVPSDLMSHEFDSLLPPSELTAPGLSRVLVNHQDTQCLLHQDKTHDNQSPRSKSSPVSESLHVSKS